MKLVTKAVLTFIIITQLLGCTFIELNMVQRAIIEDGDGTSNSHLDKAIKQESDSMELVVPIK